LFLLFVTFKQLYIIIFKVTVIFLTCMLVRFGFLGLKGLKGLKSLKGLKGLKGFEGFEGFEGLRFQLHKLN